MADAFITITGNVVADPELRHTNGGHSVAQFTVASTPRTFDKQANEWVDGETVFLRVNVWRELADGATNTLRKGDSVIVQGKLKQRSFTDKEGDKRTVFEIDGEFVGKSVRERSQGGGSKPKAKASDDGANW